jgi:hypothetical protein
MDGSHALWDDSVSWCKGSESGFGFSGFLHASVVVLLEPHVRVDPDIQQGCCFFVESYEAISDSYLCCQLQLEAFLVASSTCERGRLRLCCMKLQQPPGHPVNAFCRALLMFRDDLIDVASSCHTAKDIHEQESFGLDGLLDPLNQSCGVDCNEDW